MLVLTITEAQQMANENNCNVFALIDKIINDSPMKLSPLTMNTLTKEFEFNYEGTRLLVEADYSVEVNPNNDVVEIIGEITEVFGDGVVEVPVKTIKAEMKIRYSDEIEYIRTELKAEKKSSLRDFGARIF